MENKGWVKLWRNQFSSWISKKPFCDGYAWCYLYQKANHKAGMVNFRNEYIKVERGQLLTSKLQLQEIFGWTYRHVDNFLKALENDEMIRYRTTNRYIVITILNYDKYQSKEEKSDEQNEEQIMNRLGTDYEQIKNEATQTRINKNDKNDKNVNNNIYTPLNDKNNLKQIEHTYSTDNVSTIISYLNEKAGTNYKPTTKKTISLIKARFNEGFNLDDFKTVIDKKIKSWTGTEWERFIRPETLFGTKFESYLNEKVTGKGGTNANNRGSTKRFENEREYSDEEQRRIEEKFYA